MKPFKNYVLEAQQVIGVKAGHMTHLEDLVFELGVDGTRTAIMFMRDVRDMLTQGSGNKSAVATVKWDGAPALIMGVNPENGKFFVAKKGIFNKNPKLYYSHADIEADTEGDLQNKLKVAFTECAKLGLTSGVYQGDIMYTKDSLLSEKIEGEDYVAFHPNTIVYAVKKDSALGKRIARTNIGIVWHTTYEGKTIQELKPTFGKTIVDKFRKNATSWMEDATLTDVTGVATFTDAERKEFDQKLSLIGKTFQGTTASVINAIHNNEEILTLVLTYNNSKIRKNERVTDVVAHVDGLYTFIHDRYQKEIEKLKTEKGKSKKAEEMRTVLSFFSTHPKSELVRVFDLAAKIADAKQMLVDKLNKASSIKTFLKTESGFQVTGAEGFVAISDKGAVKLVDRMEFSRANFSAEVIKGWQR
jgi:ribosome-associated translation inhibitor RaiA